MSGELESRLNKMNADIFELMNLPMPDSRFFEHVRDLDEGIEKAQDEVKKLQAENAALKAENERLKKEYPFVRCYHGDETPVVCELKTQVAALREALGEFLGAEEFARLNDSGALSNEQFERLKALQGAGEER